ncbi:MerR family transcriptional regulator [Streptomyces sp. NPDC102467]|uniref:MerR family transcriptional regulator n=1 Tax=Streptomyces sp. NPDC102467 TaxID=3366179 RepID=UPI003822DC20
MPSSSRPTTYTRDDLARITGLTPDVLSWFEDEGLIDLGSDAAPADGDRVYHPAHLRWLEFLNHLRSTGMPLAEMTQYMELTRGGDATVAERRHLLEVHRARASAQVEGMTATLRQLDWKISFYRERERAMSAGPAPAARTAARRAAPARR